MKANISPLYICHLRFDRLGLGGEITVVVKTVRKTKKSNYTWILKTCGEIFIVESSVRSSAHIFTLKYLLVSIPIPVLLLQILFSTWQYMKFLTYVALVDTYWPDICIKRSSLSFHPNIIISTWIRTFFKIKFKQLCIKLKTSRPRKKAAQNLRSSVGEVRSGKLK